VKADLRTLPIAFCVLAAACSQAPAPSSGASSSTASAPSPAASPTPKPSPAAASPAQAPHDRNETLDAILGGKKPKPSVPEDEEEEPKPAPPVEIVVDPASGQRLVKVPKSPVLYVKDGMLYNAILSSMKPEPLVKEDAGFYYVSAPPEETPEAKAKRLARKDAEAAALPPVLEIPKEEAEVVTPKVSTKKIRLENLSTGLPKNGIWRANFALADLDGDGRPEIVSPPPRLSGQGIRIFKWTGERWQSMDAEIENPDGLPVAYGATAAGDLNGTGRNDFVWGGHGVGVWEAVNLGNGKFRVERRGLPSGVSTRALAVGDLDGDGKPDVLVLSDMPEAVEANGAKVLPDGRVVGYDVRAYMNKGDRFVELVSGLEDGPCFGYSIALEAHPVDKGAPFYVSSCNYNMGTNLLYEFDRTGMKFRNVSHPAVELFSVGLGVATGVYHGHPAAFTTYFKNRPGGAQPDPTGDGLSIYYRDGGSWHRKRLLKRIGLNRGITEAIAVGDLDGDGLDDVAVADQVSGTVRIFFQTPEGEFEEMDPSLQPAFVNFPTAIRIADVDGDGRPDIVLMEQYMTVSESKEGGFRFLRNLATK